MSIDVKLYEELVCGLLTTKPVKKGADASGKFMQQQIYTADAPACFRLISHIAS